MAVNIPDVAGRAMESLDADELLGWLKLRNIDENTRRLLREKEVTGKELAACKNVDQIRKLYPKIKNRTANKILRELEKVNPQRLASACSPFPVVRIQARRFKEHQNCTKYHLHATLVDEFGQLLEETGPDKLCLTRPIREWKACQTITHRNLNEDFLAKALAFIFATINSRANGTIYFGLEDRTAIVQGCQLIGILPHDLTEKLFCAIESVVKDSSAYTDIRNCVHRPRFIQIDNWEKKHLVMIEIDVESKSEVVKDQVFEVDLQKFDSSRCGRRLYERVETASKPLNSKEQEVFRSKLSELVKCRRVAEGSTDGHGEKANTLKGILMGGLPCCSSSFSEGRFLVLVLDRVQREPTSTGNSCAELNSVVKCCKWRVVMDLNNDCSIHDEYAQTYLTKRISIDDYRRGSYQLAGDTSRTWWIFANGETNSNLEAQKLKEWNGDRLEGVIKLKDQLRHMSSNCLIIFLFTRDDEGIMAAIYERLHKQAFCKTIFIAKYSMALENLRQQIGNENVEERVHGVIGLSWQDVGSIIRESSGELSSECEIVVSSGAFIPLSRDKWADIKILGAKEFEKESTSLGNSEDFIRARRNFYSGHAVSWLNCARSADNLGAQRHIIKRHGHAELKRRIETSKYTGQSYKIMHLFHQPGAGGSTLATHVIWEMRKHYKCGVIKFISSTTKEQIQQMYRFGDETTDSNLLNPVVLVLDEPKQDKADKFLSDLNQPDDGKDLVCIIINCKRTHAKNCTLTTPAFRHTIDVFLSQRFGNTSEKDDFLAVLNHGVNQEAKLLTPEADWMMGFMTLVSDNVEGYEKVKDTIGRYVAEITGWERRLLTYVSMLNTYNGSQPNIPTEFFDFLIPDDAHIFASFDHQNPTQADKMTSWLKSDSPAALFCTTEIVEGTRCIRIKLFSRFGRNLLEALYAGKTSELVLGFLSCRGLALSSPSTDAKKQVVRITTNMIRKRYDWVRDRPDTGRFSDLINEILITRQTSDSEEYTSGPSQAVAVVKEAFNVLEFNDKKNAFLAQLIARLLYIKTRPRDYDQAVEYAKTAIGLFPGQSSLMDTMGRICADQLNNDFTSFEEISLRKYGIAIHLSQRAQKWFERSIEATEKMKQINYSPYVGLIKVYRTLLQKFMPILQRTELSKDQQTMVKYLTDPQSIPPELKSTWPEYHDFVKDLHRKCVLRMEETLNRLSMIQPVKSSANNLLDDQTNENIEDVIKCFLALQSFWSAEPPPAVKPLDARDIRAARSREIVLLGGLSFLLIMEPERTEQGGRERLKQIKDLLEENTKNEPYRLEDVPRLLYVYLSLSSRMEESTWAPTPRFIYEFCRKCELFFQYKSDKRIYYLIICMLLWPQENMFGIEYDDKIFRSAVYAMRGAIDFYEKRKTVESYLVGQEQEYQDDNNAIRYKARTEFYLRRLSSAWRQKVIYRKDVSTAPSITKQSDDQYWASDKVARLLARHRGEITKTGGITAFNYSTKKMDIPVRIAHFSSSKNFEVGDEVEFYVGFSWDGPVAYGVQAPKSRPNVAGMKRLN